MAEDKDLGNTGEFDVLPESELEEFVGGATLTVGLATKLPSSLLKPLKVVSPYDFSKVTASLCLYDPPR